MAGRARLRRLIGRWRRAGLGPGGRRRALVALRAAAGGGPSAWRRAHEVAQNDPLLHAGAHLLALLRPGLWAATPRQRLGALIGAPLASLVRRAAGILPHAPNAGSLRQTWAARRQGDVGLSPK
ncbi:MAG: hypothetical protein JNM72_09005 [Deltaproteobacteria bacterium]|nr:hypothetical protein [Deltaproteobacteria bacterium]